MELSAPQIQTYLDYRQFLQDYYRFKKQARAGFSFRRFAQVAGFKSPNYLQLVMRGERNLSEKMADPVADAMGLRANEKRYFAALIRQENAKTDDELSKAKAEGMIALKKLVSKFMNKDAEEIFSHWHHMVVRELTALSNFEADGLWIAQQLSMQITPEQAEESLRLLLRAGFVKSSGAGGQARLEPTDPVIDSGDNLFTHARMSQFHSQTLKAWAKSIPKSLPGDQELGVLTLSLAKDKVPQLQQKIRDFQDEILGWLGSEKNPDCVVQVGTYLIPVSKVKD